MIASLDSDGRRFRRGVLVQTQFLDMGGNWDMAVPQRRDTEREGWEPDQVLPERDRQRTVAGKAHRVAPLQGPRDSTVFRVE